MEKLNLAERRKMLGNFQQQPGMQGAKIKPVVVGSQEKFLNRAQTAHHNMFRVHPNLLSQ